MKLRNKKTGEVGKLHCDMNVIPTKYGVFEDTDIRGHYWEYDSLAELNEEWEDYSPPEPLIEKRSHRGVLRAAAQMSGTSKAHVCKSDRAEVVLFEFNGKEICSVELKDKGIHTDHDGWYTIAELCGEEEE